MTNCEANAIFADVSRRDLQKSSVYDSKGDVQTNHDEWVVHKEWRWCVGSVIGKSYHEKLLNSEFAWDKNSLSEANTVIGPQYLLNKD